jgi:hypothetical protein
LASDIRRRLIVDDSYLRQLSRLVRASYHSPFLR